MGCSFCRQNLREDTILSGASIRPAGSDASIQIIDTLRPVSLAIHVARNNGIDAIGEIPNNNLREVVRNLDGIVMTSDAFTGAFFTTFEPDITGKYTVTIYNLGHTPLSVDVLVGNLPFLATTNQVNLNSLSGIIVGVILSIIGIIVLIAGVIVLVLDRMRTRPNAHTPT